MVSPYSLIEVSVNDTQLHIPAIIDKLFNFIHQNIQQGIFRINGSTKKVNHYFTNLTKVDKWLPTADVYDVCSLTKRILNTNYKFIDTNAVKLDRLVSENNFKWDYLMELLGNLDPTALNLFVYVLNRLSSFIQYNDITKMTVLNYSIVFQPILFSTDSLIDLPNYINLLNYLLQNTQHLNANDLLSNHNATPLVEAPVPAPRFESNLKYMFKNFKNKSIDSINETLRIRIPSHAKQSLNTPVTAQFPSQIDVNYTAAPEIAEDAPSLKSTESVDPLGPLSKALDQSIEQGSILSQDDERNFRHLSNTDESTRFNLMFDDLSSFISQTSLRQPDSTYDTTAETKDQELDLTQKDTALRPPKLGLRNKPSAAKLSPTSPTTFETSPTARETDFFSTKSPTLSGDSSNGSILAASSPISQSAEELPGLPEETARPSSKIVELPQYRIPRSAKSSDLSKRRSIIGLFKGDTSFVKRNFTMKLKTKNVY